MSDDEVPVVVRIAAAESHDGGYEFRQRDVTERTAALPDRALAMAAKLAGERLAELCRNNSYHAGLEAVGELLKQLEAGYLEDCLKIHPDDGAGYFACEISRICRRWDALMRDRLASWDPKNGEDDEEDYTDIIEPPYPWEPPPAQ